jgi:hypothetical protein
MTYTRYSRTNTILLVAGILVGISTSILAAMTGAFGADPVHDFRSGGLIAYLFVAELTFPLSLIMLRWCGFGAKTMWAIVLCCLAIGLLSGILRRYGGILVPLIAEALIFTGIDSGSTEDDSREPRHI